MSNPDRGAYTPPTDPPLAFDARQPVRGRGSAPVMLFASAVVLLVLIAAIIAFYRSGVNERAGPPPVVGTPVGAIKGAAPAEAQPSDPAAGLQIYQQAEGQAAPTAPNFTPPPEQPQARVASPPVVAAPLPPAPAASQPAAPVAALPAGAPPSLKPSVNATAPAVKPPAIPAPAPVAAKPAAPAPVAAKPAPAPAKAAAPVAAMPKAPAPQVPAAKPVAAKPAVATPKAEAARPAAGGVSVQIGALSSRALADKAWNEAARIAPGAAAGKGKHVEEIQKGGSTLFRTTFTGFASRADAQAFCSKLQAAGKSCFVK